MSGVLTAAGWFVFGAVIGMIVTCLAVASKEENRHEDH